MNAEKPNVVNGILVMPNHGTNAHWLWERRYWLGDDCLMWPFSKTEYGYGQVGYAGTIWKAHKLMCSFVQGERRYPEYEVRHTCGRGGDGCVNPRHLIWGTRSENGLDKKAHGSPTGKGRKRYKLTADQVVVIRTLEGKVILKAVAHRFGVSRACIWQIWRGQTWIAQTEVKAETNNLKGISVMGHETFQSMLDRLVEIRDAEYRNDPDCTAARIDSMESILQTMLEKLRDQFEPRRWPSDFAQSEG